MAAAEGGEGGGEALLRCEPAHAFFDAPWATNESRHTVRNAGGQRVAVRVKCSDPTLYRVRPTRAKLDVAATVQLRVVRWPGRPKLDHLIIQYAPADRATATVNDCRDLRVNLVCVDNDPDPRTV